METSIRCLAVVVAVMAIGGCRTTNDGTDTEPSTVTWLIDASPAVSGHEVPPSAAGFTVGIFGTDLDGIRQLTFVYRAGWQCDPLEGTIVANRSFDQTAPEVVTGDEAADGTVDTTLTLEAFVLRGNCPDSAPRFCGGFHELTATVEPFTGPEFSETFVVDTQPEPDCTNL